MKKKLSRWLLTLAQRLDPQLTFENAPEARRMGICIHISKKDVRNFRKEHPEVKSHRQGMKLLIEEAKWRVAGAIGRGMMQKGVIDFEIDKTLYVADVTGTVFLYGHKEERPAQEA